MFCQLYLGKLFITQLAINSTLSICFGVYPTVSSSFRSHTFCIYIDLGRRLRSLERLGAIRFTGDMKPRPANMLFVKPRYSLELLALERLVEITYRLRFSCLHVGIEGAESRRMVARLRFELRSPAPKASIQGAYKSARLA